MSDASEKALPPRSEREVAADAVWSLFHGEVIAFNATNVRLAANASLLTVKEIEAAKLRRDSKWYRPPSDALTEGDNVIHLVRDDPPEPVEVVHPCPDPDAHLARTVRVRDGAKNPTPGLRWCKGPTHDDEGLLVPVERFSRRGADGGLDHLCKDCRGHLAKMRYLSVTKREKLSAVGLAFAVRPDDGVDGLLCLRCGKPIVAGQTVTANAVLEHEVCPT